MNYKWKEVEADTQHELYLLIDGHKYMVASVERRYDSYPWIAFVSGFIDEGQTPVEGVCWDNLREAKHDVLTFIKVWWVSGAFKRLSPDELDAWKH